MSDETPSDVLGSLPRTRPHRRSERRASRPGVTSASGAAEERAAPTKEPEAPRKPSPRARRAKQTRLRQPAQPAGTPTAPRKPAPSSGSDVFGTAVQAAAELAEIGLSVSARAVRRAVSRLPRP